MLYDTPKNSETTSQSSKKKRMLLSDRLKATQVFSDLIDKELNLKEENTFELSKYQGKSTCSSTGKYADIILCSLNLITCVRKNTNPKVDCGICDGLENLTNAKLNDVLKELLGK